MPTISIKEKEYLYEQHDVIKFPEGLIGLPEVRQAVLIPLQEFEPFYWLASLDDEKNRFIVINPSEVFSDYNPNLSEMEKDLETWAIVKISSDWQKTTINLRAPIFVNPQTKKGAQIILTESNYSLAETFPQV